MTSRIARLCIVAFCLPALSLVPVGCRKNTPPTASDTSADNVRREQAFKSSPDAIICDLVKVKLDTLDLPEHKPYFIRHMERSNEDTLLQGELIIEQTDFVVLMPMTNTREMAFYDKTAKRNPLWWGADEIKSVHKINGRFYEFCTLDYNSKFAARPYTGRTGLFKVGKGNRQVEKAEFQGSVRSEQYSAALGDVNEHGFTDACAECVIPAGDYLPSLVHVKFDSLAVMISENYHRDQSGREMGQRPRVYGLKVRPDAPCVLDFSNEPVVIFDEPAPDQKRFKRGEEINFAAVLVDPKLDVMIRDLRDTSVEVEKEFTDSDGTRHTYKQDKSLDPTVTITRGDGSVVAEGVMPFG